MRIFFMSFLNLHRRNKSRRFNRKHRAFQLIENSFRGIADNQSRNTGSRNGTHHHEIGLEAGCHRRNHFLRVPLGKVQAWRKLLINIIADAFAQRGNPYGHNRQPVIEILPKFS